MRIRVDDFMLLPEVLQFLGGRIDLVTFQASDTEVDVSVLGSFADGGRAELDAHLDKWRRSNPTATVELLAPRLDSRPRIPVAPPLRLVQSGANGRT